VPVFDPIYNPLTIGGTFSGIIPISDFIGGGFGFGMINPIGIGSELLSVGYSTNPNTGQTQIFVDHPAGIPSTVEVEIVSRFSDMQED
jgi:hypothetical protein